MSINVSELGHAFRPSINLQQLERQVPAAFTDHAADTTSGNYVFISTKELVAALLDAGFVATQAQQSKARIVGYAAYARHMLRFQHARESVTLADAIPQIVLINSHDGRCSYQLWAGLYRPVCTNGLLTRIGDFGLIHVPHRGNVVQNVVDGALALTRDFSRVGTVIERMAARPATEQPPRRAEHWPRLAARLREEQSSLRAQRDGMLGDYANHFGERAAARFAIFIDACTQAGDAVSVTQARLFE